MPTYEYVCRDCGHHLEIVQSFSDDALTVCNNCNGSLRKVFGTVGISFKGSGFYKNDSRSSSSASSSSKQPSDTSADTSKPAEGTSSASTETKSSDSSSTSSGSKDAQKAS